MPLRRALLPLLLLLPVLAGAALPAAATPAAPVVRFQVENAAAREIAERCHEIWLAEGPVLAAALLPVDVAPDTVTCLVLNTAAFERHFARTIPDWGVGVALGNGRVVALDYQRLPAVGRGVREVFLHEMVHALLFQGTGGRWLPTWLHEGAAMRFAGEWRFVDTVSLLLEGRVPDLAGLQGAFPGSSHRADRAYRTSLLAVARLEEEHGPTVIADLVAQTRRSGDFPAAFAAVTGTSDTVFYADFAAAMRLRYGWAVVLTRWPGLFVLLALVLLVGGALKFVRARRRLAEMADEEGPERPAPPREGS